METQTLRRLFWLLALATLAGWHTAALARAEEAAAPKTELEKIEALIKHVAELKETVFIRNGVEYDAKTAAAFLKGKWDTARSSVKTAKDFIEKVATKSSTTGKAYLIRFKDGKEVKSAEYLAERLKKLEET